MLCRVIPDQGLEKVLEKLQGAEMAEIRLDSNNLEMHEVETIFSAHHNLVATFRPVDQFDDEHRISFLKAAIASGAAWVDIEMESTEEYREELMEYAHEFGCKVIISYHNYEKTPSKLNLLETVENIHAMMPDWIKIACMVNSHRDNAVLMSLYQMDKPLMVYGMGKPGKITRVAALTLGAPFTFVAITESGKTAPGQLTEQEMREVLQIIHR